MCHSSQRGFTIVSAIFLLVVLAGLGGFIATVSTTQHIGSALDVSGARAYQAARAGTEWGLYKVKTGSTCPTSPTNIGPIDTVAVTVTCTSVCADVASCNAIEAGLGNIYTITATACNMPSGGACPGAADNPNYVERKLTVTAEF